MDKISHYLEKYSFYEKIFDCQVGEQKTLLSVDQKAEKFFINLKSGVYSGFPPIAVQSGRNLDPKNLTFFVYYPGKTYWDRLDLNGAALYVIAFFEKFLNKNLTKETAIELIVKTLYRSGEELGFPQPKDDGYLVNFLNKHVFIFKDGTYLIEDPNPNYYLRNSLKVNFRHSQ